MRVLVTGASGFLGIATRRALEAAGMVPVATDRAAGEDVAALDVTDQEQVHAFVGDCVNRDGLDAVIHLAAAGLDDQGLVAGAEAHTSRAVHVNVEGFVHVIEAAARHGVARAVWSSSTTVYGPRAMYGHHPIGEDAPMLPQNAYGVTKTACEHLAPILARRLNVDVTSLRLPMVYGPDRWYGGSQQPLVDLMRSLHAASPEPIWVWTGDADWVHVDDAAASLTTLATTPPVTDCALGQARAYHIVGHRGSLAALAHAVIGRTGAERGEYVRHTPNGAPDIPPIDDRALRRDTDFAPRYTAAEQGAATYFEPARVGTPSGRHNPEEVS